MDGGLLNDVQIHDQTLQGLHGAPQDTFIAGTMNMPPPVLSHKFLTLPQFPVGMVDFQINHTQHKFGTAKQNTGYISIVPGTPMDFLRVPKWKELNEPHVGEPPSPGLGPHEHALGMVIKGRMIEGKPPAMLVDPVHHLSVNHLFVPIPVNHLAAKGDYPGLAGPAPLLPTVADILVIIDASKHMGHIESNGRVVWHPGIVDFLNKFIHLTPLGPDSNRIGVVVVSFGIDDMIPLTNDRKFLIGSLNMLRPTFRGGCSEKGISTAGSLFYQYGRPNAVKRIVLLTEGSGKCQYRNMEEIIYARKCGIDIIHVGFGPSTNPLIDDGFNSHWLVPDPEMLIKIVEPVAKRAYIDPVHGGWSPWSDWNFCSASGSCSIGYQMRFRLCDNPKPLFGGQNCHGYPAETRMCHMRHCMDNSLGHWTRWTDFTPCSAACGVGSQTRSRTCLTLGGNPSATCQGKYVDVRECFIQECPVDGEWSMWSEWGLCSQVCGSGIKIRVRQCDNPPPKHGGTPCKGIAVEEDICDTGIVCPIHGGFGPWSSFGKCDALCGVGKKWRTRECNNPVPQFGGMPCEGDFKMFEVCDTGIPCPIHGLWGLWTEFTPCSVKCGVGFRNRERFCNNPPPQYGGAFCEGPSVEEHNCDTGISCPIDGQWSAWTDFKQCTAICGVGVTKRTRLCNNPIPMNGGLDCKGLPVEEKPCDTGIPCPINGGWSLWSKYSPCSVDCGRGIQTRVRDCTNPKPEYGGSYCVGLDAEEKECDTGVSCPVHGFWSLWLPWGSCSAHCGIGFRQRHRLCNNPSPKFGGLECKGSLIEEDICDTRIPCPIHGGWSEWSPPLPCSVNCGIGTSQRVRECNNPIPMYGGDDCFGPNNEVIECDTGVKCPVHGKWSFWSKWSVCDAKCGTSIQQRVRTCDNPPPMFGGLHCEGPFIEERLCDTGIPCPIDGGWSFWTKWTNCAVACGIGMISRTRACDNPPPAFGGASCNGADFEEKPCDTAIPCPINGNWSPWSDLSSCSASCGEGTMQRSRSCNNPPPQYNGLNCEGFDFEKLPCDTGIPCPVHGNWGQWIKFTQCNVNCGVGIQTRTRECNSPEPMFGGHLCVGPGFEEMPCDTGTYCPVNGNWGPWTEFSLCSKGCGIGIIHRTRMCDSPAPMYGGLPCEGLDIDEQTCDTGVNCPVDGNWGMWSKFTKCSVSCGLGFHQRHRECNDPPPLYGGGDCAGIPLETRECDSGAICPLDGGWTLWTDFGSCSAICGVGLKRRERSCTQPVPMYGGTECAGYNFEEIPCDSGLPCPIDGRWTHWSGWSVCSVDCGVGSTTRTRECSNPQPMYGGLDCKGPSSEEEVCDTGIFCPIHGSWSVWSEYSLCSVKCGIGTMQRIRVCDSPMPQYGGLMCVGDSTEIMPCDTGIFCPIDGGFSPWSDWSPCTVKCGEGIQSRSRLCDSPAPMYGGASCTGYYTEERVCDTGIFCPIDGIWGEWSTFSTCSVVCGVGFMERTRFCDSPMPMHGGQPCEGYDTDLLPCDTGIPCPVNGEWSFWSSWTGCSVDCDVGFQERRRTCTNPEPMWGGLPCKGDSIQEQVCNTGIPCPVNGMWSFWSDWLKCDAKCGVGTQVRVRVCDNPPPKFGGMACEGPSTEHLPCDTGIPCPVIGNWSPWSPWGECTATCAVGLQPRFRTCTDPPPMYGGEPCPGISEEIRNCDTNIVCPVDGQWTPWTKWTHCSVSCGVGMHARTRFCDNPPPQYGGMICFGPQEERGGCDTGVPCPIDGHWSPWSDFGLCNVHCGIGVQTRIRECNNPMPQFDGIMCFGGNTEDRPCDTGVFCPVDGGWTHWTPFSKCNADCGVGIQERTRECAAPVPQHGGLPCKGPAVDVVECDSGVPCPIHGGWSLWYEWATCLGDCGIGIRERRRDCSNPKPNFGGLPCKGPDIITEKCDTGVHCPINGGWSDWSHPTPCSVACGVGIQSRHRECSNPVPQYGGLGCIGSPEQIRDCDTMIPCPIDGMWGLWSDFGYCNVKCGVGLHTRTRLCDMPPPQFGGRKCIGLAVEETQCDTNIECPIHGGWSFWSPWSTCQASCGVGDKFRVRVCNSPSPLYGGLMCQGPDEDFAKCDSGVSCPIDGGWTPWTDWDVCNVKCGAGQQNRYRECTAPVPEFGGMQCQGLAVETIMCDSGIACPIDGQWTLWSLWTGCSESCGMGVRSRERFCDNPPAQFGGVPCKGVALENQDCDTGVPCPIHGLWSGWTEWSVCLADCGLGKQVRNRVCNAPTPMYGGMDCVGPSEEIRDCDTKIACPINGHWGFWTPWTVCTAKCGIGDRKRIRECNNPPAQFGGIPCKGFAEEMEVCDTMIPCPIDGHWSPWSKFTTCSAKCGMGMQTRTRVCNNPPAQFGGFECTGFAEETISCDTGVACPIHGHWGEWYAWSKCNVLCGVGEMERHRDCKNPPPQFGGLPCEGPAFEIGPCDTKIICPIHGNWGAWSYFTKCTGKCGLGTQERLRECNSPIPMHGGEPCKGPEREIIECETGVPCPIHGNWGMWIKWGKCSVDCGIGIHSRTRFCDSPPPQFAGNDCLGPAIEERKCDTLKPCVLHGGWSFWSQWSVCSSDCGLGTKSRFRECTNPVPQYGGMLCVGPDQEVTECDSGVPCPIDGHWGPWYQWSLCSVKCGIGMKERIRECNSPQPQFGGLPCHGPITEVVECDTGIHCPIDGHWNLWSPWGACSTTCGAGVQHRIRLCDNPPPAFGGLKCQGFAEEMRECDSGIHCSVHGNWGMWSEFTVCSASCGFGFQERVRLCNNPAPEYGGMDCAGPAVEQIKCDSMVPCPIDGYWTLWSQWTNCDAACGIGIRERVRQCANPAPNYGGRPCDGPALEVIECDSQIPCTIDGNWSPWSHWDACSVSCGAGRQFRYRICDNPRPKFGGKACVGLPEEIKECDTGVTCAIDGHWSHWSVWGQCEAVCGIGYQRRIRECNDPPPSHGGQICLGIPQERRTCDTGIPCPVDGNWSPWSVWDICDAKCGFGYQTRIRMCNDPRPQFGGQICLGISQERQKCDSGVPCPIHGNWGLWSVWEQCNAVCGIGARKRFRECNNPAPQFGGLFCEGYDIDTEKCDTGVLCQRPGGWSLWTLWSACTVSCGKGFQFRERSCDNPPPLGIGMECKGFAQERIECDTGIPCPIHGGWTEWAAFGLCFADCSQGLQNAIGFKVRQRYCEKPVPSFGGMQCPGNAIEKVQCFDHKPCFKPEWIMWTKWTKCSESCGPGQQERTRECLDGTIGRPTGHCEGLSREVVQCKVLNCPITPINCSAECKWDNGIGYADYPGDCTMFVQCDKIDGVPVVQDCPFGLLWSLNYLQCVFPAQSECDVCSGAVGRFRAYHISCRAYWDCTHAVPVPKCCAKHERFNPFTHQCEVDEKMICNQDCPPVDVIPIQECMFRVSSLGSEWYEQEINGLWIPRPCSAGTIFSEAECQCIYYTDGLAGPKQECKPELHLMFDTLEADLARNTGLHVVNVKYLGDGTAYFDGTAAINDNIFSNAEWGKDVYVYIRFKPEGQGHNQGLVHNSGCGPSDIGPSVFIGLDRQPQLHGPDMINMKFAAVPKKKSLEYDFVNITTPANKMIDAWFKFGKGQFIAEVDGLVAQLDIPGASEVARRHGSLNIGGNLCKIGNESFEGFVGTLDEVRIYKCKPAGHF